jgi:C-terminal processing protease CtpA/Prc
MKVASAAQPLRNPRVISAVLALLFALCGLSQTKGQSLSAVDKERAHVMLDQLKDDIKKNYYDPAFHGLDIDMRFKEANEALNKATSLGQVFGIIAQTVIRLDDSHTFFLPPDQSVHSEYGWRLQAIGDKCYVVAVKPGSDAEAKGLKPGDEVLQVNGIPPMRAELWKFRYLYYTLRPQAGMHLLIRTPAGEERALDVLAKVKTEKVHLDVTQGDDYFDMIRSAENESQMLRHRYLTIGDNVFVWKMPLFGDPERVDVMMDRVGNSKALILDLRGNGGGAVETLQRLVGRVFDKDITIGTMKRRKENKPLIAKTSGKKAFGGKLMVLIDSDSGSAAELFARVVQLEKRGTVIGDRSAGAVMVSKRQTHQMGMDVAVFYGVSVTDADIIMTDGKSLEHGGVIPDELVLPTGKELAAKLDPALVKAAELLEVKLDPTKAGALFPYEWVKN